MKKNKFSSKGGSGYAGKTILYISLDSFFTSVEKALHPELRNQPVIISNNIKPNSLVACSSYEARNLGINKIMTLSKAYEIAPQAKYIAGSFEQYELFSQQFFKIISQYSKKIEPISLDEAYIDISGFEEKWISPEQAANDIRNKLYSELEITSSVGIASNKICARIACQSQKPNAITYVPWGQEKEFISGLPIKYLPAIGPRTEIALKSLNIHTIGHLANMPQAQLVQTFGNNGLQIWKMANALDDREVYSVGIKKSITRSNSFEFATNDQNLIFDSLLDQIKIICNSLKSQKKTGNVLSIKITFNKHSIKTKRKQFNMPLNNYNDLAPLANQLLNEILPLSTKIISVSATIHDLLSYEPIQSIFEKSFFKIKKIQNAIDILSNKFGFKSAYQLKPSNPVTY
ncbi:MAG: Y-family DNA polymerase [Candidatus Kerfeldbacteria bacterium]